MGAEQVFIGIFFRSPFTRTVKFSSSGQIDLFKSFSIRCKYLMLYNCKLYEFRIAF